MHKLGFLKYWVPVLVYAVIIFINSSMPPAPMLKEIEIPFFDKMLHSLCYSILGMLLLRALSNYGYNISRKHMIFMAVLLGTLYGISDEIHQSFVPERSADVVDAIFDFFGCAIGVFIYNHRVQRYG